MKVKKKNYGGHNVAYLFTHVYGQDVAISFSSFVAVGTRVQTNIRLLAKALWPVCNLIVGSDPLFNDLG